MNVEEVCAYCQAKKGAESTFPFGETTLVMKVMGKIFALIPLDEDLQSISLKCDPERVIELRETYPEDVIPGYHLNKKHWNTVICEGGLSKRMIQELIDHSYDLVVDSLPKKLRAELEAME